jgi:hypothetical protein
VLIKAVFNGGFGHVSGFGGNSFRFSFRAEWRLKDCLPFGADGSFISIPILMPMNS